MEKKDLKYGLKLEGRFSHGSEVFTYEEVRRLQVVFLGCADGHLEHGDLENADLFQRLANVFDLRVVND